jgi:hypothetical protein
LPLGALLPKMRDGLAMSSDAIRSKLGYVRRFRVGR